MKTTLFFSVLLLSTNLMASTLYMGEVTYSVGDRAGLTGQNCVAVLDEDTNNFELIYGTRDNLFSRKMALSKSEVYIGEKIMGYQLGSNQYFESENEKSKLLNHTLLKVNSKDEMKVNELFTSLNAVQLNTPRAPYFHVKCTLKKVN